MWPQILNCEPFTLANPSPHRLHVRSIDLPTLASKILFKAQMKTPQKLDLFTYIQTPGPDDSLYKRSRQKSSLILGGGVVTVLNLKGNALSIRFFFRGQSGYLDLFAHKYLCRCPN